jgi:hypothetical protein
VNFDSPIIQGPILQFILSWLSPTQVAPPFCGVGLLHNRVRVAVPL